MIRIIVIEQNLQFTIINFKHTNFLLRVALSSERATYNQMCKKTRILNIFDRKTYVGTANCFFCSSVQEEFTFFITSIWSKLHQWSMEAPKNEDDKWWKPIKQPSIHVNRKIIICHLSWSPTMDKMSSNLYLAADPIVVQLFLKKIMKKQNYSSSKIQFN